MTPIWLRTNQSVVGVRLLWFIAISLLWQPITAAVVPFTWSMPKGTTAALKEPILGSYGVEVRKTNQSFLFDVACRFISIRPSLPFSLSS
jgi:hypothetical protein